MLAINSFILIISVKLLNVRAKLAIFLCTHIYIEIYLEKRNVYHTVQQKNRTFATAFCKAINEMWFFKVAVTVFSRDAFSVSHLNFYITNYVFDDFSSLSVRTQNEIARLYILRFLDSCCGHIDTMTSEKRIIIFVTRLHF